MTLRNVNFSENINVEHLDFHIPNKCGFRDFTATIVSECQVVLLWDDKTVAVTCTGQPDSSSVASLALDAQDMETDSC